MISQRHKDYYARLTHSFGENRPGFMHDKAANIAGPYSNPFAATAQPVVDRAVTGDRGAAEIATESERVREG